MTYPFWLTALAWVSLGLGVITATWVALDVARHPPPMAVMRVVWPICGLFGHLLLLWFYLRHGRTLDSDGGGHGDRTPLEIATSKGALHCGAGCTLGDIIAESLVAAFPAIAVAFGFGSLFGQEIFAVWVFDFILAFAIGIVFQYFAIAPMRGLGLVDGVVAAVKADTASLAAWQVGMYGGMALLQFGLFLPLWQHMAKPTGPVFWFAMQLAMCAGFLTAWPVNRWLISAGLKERM